jgi:hypothetical protein
MRERRERREIRERRGRRERERERAHHPTPQEHGHPITTDGKRKPNILPPGIK